MIRKREGSTDTLAVHAGRGDFARMGVHASPIDLSSTYPLPDLDLAIASLDELASGGADAPSSIYARLHNPTVARFEEGLAELEGAAAAVAFASGMAAITATLLAASGGADGARRRHVVAVRPVYGGTDHLLSSGLLGLETTFVSAAEVGAAIRPDTALVLLETPSNPTLDLVDIARVVDAAGSVPVVVDSTFATPILQRPLELGAALSLHSATKFIGGHGDVVAGIVATSEAWAHRLRQVRIATGAILHPLAAFLLHRGLPTLPMRVRRAQETAGELARRLAVHPAVAAVHYPGLPGQDPEGILKRQMKGPGAILAFELAGGHEAARHLLGALNLLTCAVSLGSTDTLIEHPAGLTHRLVEPHRRAECGISEGLLRVSVGLEDVEDLWADLEPALAMTEIEAAELVSGA